MSEAKTSDTGKWVERVIPLPKEVEVKGSVRVAAGGIAVSCDSEKSPAVRTAVGLIRSFAKGQTKGAGFVIHLKLAEAAESKAERAVRHRLRLLPNHDQAYSISTIDGGSGLLLLANTPQGLLYAARTLVQMVDPQGTVGPDTMIDIPLVSIIDWPDLAERGQWGGGSEGDLAWTSQWKLNALEANSRAEVDGEGAPIVRIRRELIEQGRALGVKVVPYILHLEQLSKYAKLKNKKDTASVPDPAKQLPSDYSPGLCMSSEATRDMVYSWLEKIGEIDGITDIMVWLSEERAPCYCDRCKGKEPFELEVACIVGAFRQVQAQHPGLHLRLLLTQGSYAVNDKVLAAAPEDVGITYYDGGRTYDSSRQPMIYPLLTDSAKSGRWLGVYPQITHSWRTVFPWSGPQFVRFRAREFVDKRLACMIGYAVPSNRYHEFNVAAEAEWTWNANGRPVEEFCRAYAVRTGICEPGLFARWAELAGEAGWSLAESKLLLTVIYSPSLGLGTVPFDHRFASAGVAKGVELDKALSRARKALALAQRAGNADMISESECALAGLEAFEAIKSASAVLTAKSASEKEKTDLSAALDRLDHCASTLRSELLAWGGRVSGGSVLPGRLIDTAYALLRTCDVFRVKAASLGVNDPRPESRLRKIREWSSEDFANGPDVTLRVDLSSLVLVSGGNWHVGFDFVSSDYGTDIKKIVVVEKNGSSEAVVATTPDPMARISRWDPVKEMRLEIPKRASDSQLFLDVSLSGPPTDAPVDRRSCSGTIGLRGIDP